MGRIGQLDLHPRRAFLAEQAGKLHLHLDAPDAARASSGTQAQPARGRLGPAARDTHGYPAHLRQNAGVSTTSSVNSSRRPSSMPNEHTQVWKSFSTA